MTPGQFITLGAAGRQAEHVGKPTAIRGGPGGVWQSRGEGSEGRRDRPEVYRGRHLKCAPIADFAVRDSSQAEQSAGKMSYSRSVTLLLLLAVLARGKSSTTTANHCNSRGGYLHLAYARPYTSHRACISASDALLIFLCAPRAASPQA